MTHRRRQPAGIRTGGQFAPDHRPEPAVSLANQQAALRALGAEGLRAPRAFGGGTQPALPGMPRNGASSSSWLLSPAARYRAGEETVAGLASLGWEPVAPVEQPDARFAPQTAVTNGELIVQSYVLPGRDTTCLVMLPAADDDGADRWLDAQFISMQGREVSVHTVQAATGIVSLAHDEAVDAPARRGRLDPADLARLVHDDLAG